MNQIDPRQRYDHAASYKVDVMMRCFYKALDWGFFHFKEREGD